MKTVWAVSSGEYSSYQVHCLFESEELAEAYVAALVAFGRDIPEDKGGPLLRYEEPFTESFQMWDAVPVVSLPADESWYYSYRQLINERRA